MLERWQRLARDPAPILDAMGLLMVGKFQSAFRNQGRGDRWAPRGVPNRLGVLVDLAVGKTPPARRFEPRPAGIDTGRLRGSIAHRVESPKVFVGSALEYASDFQRGGSRTVSVPKPQLAAWLRSLRDSSQKDAAREAFGPLFRKSSLTTTVPPRKVFEVTDEDMRELTDMAARWFTGGGE